MSSLSPQARRQILQERLNGLQVDIDTIIERLDKPTDPVISTKDTIWAICLLTTAVVILTEVHLYQPTHDQHTQGDTP